MKKEDKITLLENYYLSLCKSWTYKRMTEEEKQRWQDIKEWIKNCGTLDHMTTEKNIIYCCLSCYHSFLQGIGYTDSKWRE